MICFDFPEIFRIGEFLWNDFSTWHSWFISFGMFMELLRIFLHISKSWNAILNRSAIISQGIFPRSFMKTHFSSFNIFQFKVYCFKCFCGIRKAISTHSSLLFIAVFELKHWIVEIWSFQICANNFLIILKSLFNKTSQFYFISVWNCS